MADKPEKVKPTVQQAAQKLLGKPEVLDGMPGDAPKRKYRSPSEFRSSGFAQKINDGVDHLDASPATARFHNPAHQFMLGECAMATAAEMGGPEELDIHPGWLLLGSSVATAVVIFANWKMYGPAKGDEEAPKEGRFASLK